LYRGLNKLFADPLAGKFLIDLRVVDRNRFAIRRFNVT